MRWLMKLFVWGGVAFFGVVALAAVAGSQVLPPGTDGPADGCAGQVPIVVGSDRSAQSDLYSAVTLAGVIDTSCIVLAGPRDGEMPADQVARLDAALGSPASGSLASGWVMGGEAAVPESKIAGRGLKRLNGVDRWHTARLAGAIALDPDGDVVALTEATAPAEGELGGGSVIVDGAEVRLPPGLDASCAGQVPIVVAVDAAAQSDLYSAATLAGVLDTTCYVLAGPRGEPMAAEQLARLGASETALGTGGWIVGGIAAVPDAKVAGFTLTRIGGADRWETARLIGEAAVAQAARNAAAPAESTTTTAETRSAGGSSGGGSARSSGGGGGGGGSSRRVSSGGGGVSRPPTGTPAGGTPSGTPPSGTTTTTSSTSTTMPGNGGTTTMDEPGDTTMPGDPTTSTTTTTGPPRMASEFTPMVAVSVPQLAGTTGDNIWATNEFEVTLARASGADGDCSLGTSRTVTFTVQSDGTVTDDGSAPATLIGTTATGAMCSYTVTFPAPPTDSPGGDFDWMMSPAAATEVTLSDATTADNSATGAYTVGAVTFAPAATITVPAGHDGATFSVGFEGSTANCSGALSAMTLTYTVPTGGTTAQPDVTNQQLIAYPAGATVSTPVCSYTVIFPANENGGAATLALETANPAPDTEASGTSQAISATYAAPPMASTFTAVSSGGTFSCALQSDGSAFCWGDNTHDQLTVPPLPPGVSFTQVSASHAHACALTTHGEAKCWGDNSHGQTTVPPLPTGVTFTQVSAGVEHSCGVTSSGTVDCWGADDFDQSTLPPDEASSAFTQVSAGALNSCAVKSDQRVVCWGEDRHGRVATDTPPELFRSVSVGSFYACGVKTDGEAECWGDNDAGRTMPPTGSFTSVSAGYGHACGVKTDATVECWGFSGENRAAPPDGSFAAVSAGDLHSCGLTPHGAVVCWGYGNLGQATAPSGAFALVSVGEYHSCGIKTDDTTECWGDNTEEQTTLPALVGSERFTRLDAGESHTCGLKNDNTVACWGDNGVTGAQDGRVSDTPSGVDDLFSAVAAGWRHSCAIRSGGATDGEIVCWGTDQHDQASPLDPGAGNTFTALDAGLDHTCALKSDMSVVCWGRTVSPDDGRVSGTPGETDDLFAALAVGDRHACAVLAADSTVACWGDNEASQSTPLTGAFSVLAAGSEHTCGIRSGGADDGTVACWGSNAAGQADPPEGTFDALAAGTFHTCGIRSGGTTADTVVCWGAGTAWQLITARPPSSS